MIRRADPMGSPTGSAGSPVGSPTGSAGSPTDSTTVSEGDGRAEPRDRAGHRAPPTPALVVTFCADEPERTGEVIVLPAGEPGSWSLLGRGASRSDDPHPRLQLVRSRPGQ